MPAPMPPSRHNFEMKLHHPHQGYTAIAHFALTGVYTEELGDTASRALIWRQCVADWAHQVVDKEQAGVNMTSVLSECA